MTPDGESSAGCRRERARGVRPSLRDDRAALRTMARCAISFESHAAYAPPIDARDAERVDATVAASY